LTISVGTDGVMQMVWDPIYADDLMGYSVLEAGRRCRREFTRISIPFKSGKEVKKLPMTTKARYLFRDARSPYGIRVVCEYEDGSSKPSANGRIRLARQRGRRAFAQCDTWGAEGRGRRADGHVRCAAPAKEPPRQRQARVRR